MVYDRLADNRPVYIAPGLWLGSCAAEANIDALLGAKISHVVTVGMELRPTYPGKLTYLHVPLLDSPSEDLLRHFQAIFSFIDSAIQSGSNVLVHCLAGVSRSSSTVIGYLMWKERIPYHEARRRVADVRSFIRPNPGFQQQLLHFFEMGCKVA